MAFSTGTATDLNDLTTKLVSFLTTNAALVAASQAWTQVWTAPGASANPTAIVLRGPGTSGADNVYVGLQKVSVPGDPRYEIQFCGLTQLNATASILADHQNVSPLTRVFADNTPMTYWFVASGRRFFIMTKMSTVYSVGYFGLILPYSLPTSYPYAVFIGGSAADGPSAPVDWRSTDVTHSSFLVPAPVESPLTPSCAFVATPSGSWQPLQAREDNPLSYNLLHAFIHPFADMGQYNDDGLASPTGREVLRILIDSPGAEFPLIPCTIMTKTPGAQVYGALDDVYATAGFGNAAENILTIGAEQYLVFPNTFRASVDQYGAIRIA